MASDSVKSATKTSAAPSSAQESGNSQTTPLSQETPVYSFEEFLSLPVSPSQSSLWAQTEKPPHYNCILFPFTTNARIMNLKRVDNVLLSLYVIWNPSPLFIQPIHDLVSNWICSLSRELDSSVQFICQASKQHAVVIWDPKQIDFKRIVLFC
jgi:hypothetical protein